jgi:hypothetical protein
MNEKVLKLLVRDLLKKSMEIKDCKNALKEVIDIVVNEMVLVVKDSHLTKKDEKIITQAKNTFLISLNSVEHSQ